MPETHGEFTSKTADDVKLNPADVVTKADIQRDYVDDPNSQYIDGDVNKGVRAPGQGQSVAFESAKELNKRYTGETDESDKQ